MWARILAVWNEERRCESPSNSSTIDLSIEGETTFWMRDHIAHAMFLRQNVTTSVLLGVKHIDLGNGGAVLPGSLGKLKRLDMVAVKRNSP